MSTKKVRMSDFHKSREEKERQQELSQGEQEARPAPHGRQERRENLNASPMLGGSKTAGLIKKTERKTMRMPVSGKEVVFVAQSRKASEFHVHPHNQRIQSLLRLENPRVNSLYQSMKTEQQREPVHARWITVDGQREVEILDGSRRRFVGSILEQEDPEFLLKAWIGEVNDADAEFLAKTGNDERDDISPWELGQYLMKQVEENPEWTHEVLAHNERMSRTSVTNHLAIAEIPIEIVAMLETPDLLKVKSGLQVLRLLKDCDSNAYLKELEKGAPYKNFSDLVKRLQNIMYPPEKKQKPAANRKVVISQGDTVRAEVGKNRSKPGQYKIDLFKITESEYEKILAALKETLSS